MKKLILNIIIGLSVLISFSSCITGAYAQEIEIGNDDAKMIITYGTPYFYDGVLIYYNYNNLYYYPYILNGRTHYRAYPRPLPHHRHVHHAVPRHHGGHWNRPPIMNPDRIPPRSHGHSSIGNRPMNNRPSSAGGHGGMRPNNPNGNRGHIGRR